MSVRDCLAASMGRTDEAPNVALAIEIADSLDAAAIAELFGIVRTGVTALQGDAIKVIYETAEREPALIAPFDSELINLLHSCNNRLTWGAMHALALVAPISANSMQPRIAEIVAAVQAGSVITQDWGIRALAELAIANPAANDATRTFWPNSPIPVARKICQNMPNPWRQHFPVPTTTRQNSLKCCSNACRK